MYEALVPAIVLAAIAIVIVWRGWRTTVVYAPSVALLYRNGRFERELPPGRHVRFDPLDRTQTYSISLIESPQALGEITVLAKDQFSFRVGLAPVLKVVDPRAYKESQPTPDAGIFGIYVPVTHASLHPLASAAALEVVSQLTLAEILANQRVVAERVQARLVDAIPGAVIEEVLLTSINLPPETRRMFTDVERAKMEGQASLERARGEQAALRVLANAARLLNDNPSLANLRLLQSIESSKGSTTVILGNGSGLPSGVLTAAGSSGAG